jgi:NADH:quinone reductase (non-electrogenic)
MSENIAARQAEKVRSVLRRAVGTRSSRRAGTARPFGQAGTRILILGAGFAGVRTALQLDRLLEPDQDVDILLVDRGNSQLYYPLLWLVAGGQAGPNDVVVPLRTLQRGRSFHVLHA